MGSWSRYGTWKWDASQSSQPEVLALSYPKHPKHANIVCFLIPQTSKICIFLGSQSWTPRACSPKPGGNGSLWHLSSGKPMISTRKWYTHGGVSRSAVRGWRVYRRVLFMACPKLDTRNQQGMERSIEPNGTITRQNYVYYFTNPKQGDLGN
jgi:hypothetical protein